jgi:putative oxidoreductase
MPSQTKLQSYQPQVLAIFRIVAAFLFIQTGAAKLFAFPAAVMPGGGTAPLLSLAGVAGALETFGGALLLIGLFTRSTSFLLCGLMACAYFLGHASASFWTVLNMGTPAVLYCFLWLYLVFAGAGAWSVDGWLAGRRTTRPASSAPGLELARAA